MIFSPFEPLFPSANAPVDAVFAMGNTGKVISDPEGWGTESAITQSEVEAAAVITSGLNGKVPKSSDPHDYEAA